MCLAPQRRAIFRPLFDIRTSQNGPNTSCFNILTCKCASRYSGVQIFHSPTSKNALTLRCFVHFDLQPCFAPQRRAIFGHPNFQKCSRNVRFLAFWLANVLRATASCLFSTSQLPKVLRRWGVSLTFRAGVCSFLWLSRDCIFFLLALLLFSAFHLLTLLLCSAFSTVHIVGS